MQFLMINITFHIYICKQQFIFKELPGFLYKCDYINIVNIISYG